MSKIELEALRNRLIIEKEEAQETTAGGIIIPEVAREKPVWGTVTSVGPGELSPAGYELPMETQVGDVVLFPKHSGVNIEIESQKFFVISEREVLGRRLRDDELSS